MLSLPRRISELCWWGAELSVDVGNTFSLLQQEKNINLDIGFTLHFLWGAKAQRCISLVKSVLLALTLSSLEGFVRFGFCIFVKVRQRNRECYFPCCFVIDFMLSCNILNNVWLWVHHVAWGDISVYLMFDAYNGNPEDLFSSGMSL